MSSGKVKQLFHNNSSSPAIPGEQIGEMNLSALEDLFPSNKKEIVTSGALQRETLTPQSHQSESGVSLRTTETKLLKCLGIPA